MTFNTLYSTAGLEQGVERLMFGALVRVNDKLEAVPDLAEKVDVSPDAKTYTFTLKKGITFSDGKPLTSKDVRFTFERAVDKRAATYWRGRLLDIQGATEYGDQQADEDLRPGDAGRLHRQDDAAEAGLDLAAHARRLLRAEHPAGAHPQGRRAGPAADAPFSLNPNVSAGAFKFVKYETDQYLRDRSATTPTPAARRPSSTGSSSRS